MSMLALSSKTHTLACYIFFVAIALKCATSARILEESTLPGPFDPAASFPSGQMPIFPPDANVAPLPIPDVPITIPPPVADVTPLPKHEAPEAIPPPVADVAPIAHDADVAPLPEPETTGAIPPPVTDVAPIAHDADMAPLPEPETTGAIPPPVANVAAPENPHLTFFMHDILGGTHPSARVVTGIVANSDFNNLPFSKSNNQVFPINGGIPLNSVNGVINNNNAPFLAGLKGSPTSVLQNSGNSNNNAVASNNNNLPFVTAGQLPTGVTLQQLMFGSITVVDNEITEGHELGTGSIGKVQGFYLSSSLDGTSHTLVLTALFQGNENDVVDDTISFFGIHRTGSLVSEIAVIGGTGKYEDAKGYASIEALPQQDQHTTDGVETITQFGVYLTPI